jgi:hypothetical protein
VRNTNLCRLVSAVMLTVFSAFAQSDRGTITGTVSDPASAVVTNAKITVRNTATGVTGESATTATGNFTIASLPAGIYDLSVEAAGFKKTTQKGVQVQVAQVIRLDIVLQIGSTTDSVTVTEQAPLLKSENAEQSINVSGDRINNLPLNFGGGGGAGGNIRSWTAFALLSPGVVGNSNGNRANGAQANQFKIIVEGQDVTSSNDTGWTSTVSQASVEMIQEFSLQTSNYAAEFGQVAGGLFNFTTRSGTNTWHGTAYEYFANEALDAHRPFTHIRPTSRKHDGGFSIGGPVTIPKIYNGKNRTFFFFNYEFFRNRAQANASFQSVPTAAYREGDFSAAMAQNRRIGTDPRGNAIIENMIFDPLTNSTFEGRIYRMPFANNRIPASRIDPVALAVQKLIPAPINGNLIQNWVPNNDNTRYQGLPGVKFDHNFNPNHRTTFYYSKQSTDQRTANDGLPDPITAVRVQAIYGHTTRLNYDWVAAPTLVLHFGAGYLRFHNPDSSPASVLDYDAAGGIGFRGSATNPGGFPRIAGLGTAAFGGMNLGMGPTNANRYYDGKWTSVASATYIRNNHTYKLGGEFRLDSWTDRNTRGSQGILNFTAAETSYPALQGVALSGGVSGFPYASFLLGAVNNASVNAVQDPQWRKKSYALYLQDSWKVTRRLSVDYGLRWDLMTQGHEIYFRNSMFGPSIPNPAVGGRPGAIVYEGYGNGRCNCQFTDNYPYAIGPRLGAAYQINEKTVFRAGAGIIYSNLPTLGYLTNSAILGVGFDQQVWSNPGYADSAALLREGLPVNLTQLYTPTLDPGLRPRLGAFDAPGTMFDRNGARPGRVLQWNLSLQREVIKGLVVEAAYVGNRSSWLTQNNIINPNALSDQTLSAYGLNRERPADLTLLASRIDSAAAIQRGFVKPYASFPNTGTVAQSLRPFPQFNAALQPRWAPLGNSWYDSLQVKVTKRYSHGLDFTAAFTFAKELSTNGANADVFNRGTLKGLTGGGIPLIFVTGFNYEMPKLTENRVVRALVGGWTVGGILRYQSGTLIAAPTSNNNLNAHTFQSTRMERVPGQPLYLKDLNCHCIDPYKDLVFNPAAWRDVPQGQWGPGTPFYNDFRNARRPDEQFSLGRMFNLSKWREGMSFQVRAEMFNAFNRLYLANPAGGPASATTFNAQGRLTGGFGWIDPTSTSGGLPRNGQLVGRFQW